MQEQRRTGAVFGARAGSGAVFGAGAENRSDSARSLVWCRSRGRGRDIVWRRGGGNEQGK